IAWRELGDIAAARRYFVRLAAHDGDHPALVAFQQQTGENLAPAAARGEAPTAAADEVPPVLAPVAAVAAEPVPSAEAGAPTAVAATPDAAVAEAAAPPQGAGENAAVIADLRAKLAQQEEAKRYHEYVKTLIALGDELADPAEKASCYAQAAEVYLSKSSNQAEAVKAYEKVVEYEPTHPVAAEYLRQMYEKRRDWEKLIALAQREVALMPRGPERAAKFKAIATLATERVRKPEICTELWAGVLAEEPDDVDALGALSQLYERSREYDKLADVLERLVEFTYDTNEKIQLLTKLGQIVGDRLNDDVRAVEAYRQLLTLSPDDRRAQEQLKKRYVTLGRWDDLELFYADSGKWDEFIRVLETNETKTEDTAQRVGMLMKVAELWMTQKGKPDRASRAYEKVLSLDENNLAAAERLIPLYAQANNPKGLAQAIEVKLGHVQEPGERVGLLREVAGIYATRINDKARAFDRFLAAFELYPGDEQSQADVERAAQVTGRWEDLVVAYRAAIAAAEAAGDAATVTALRLRLGRVLVDEVGRIDDALVEYRTVHEAEPDNAAALEALEKLYRQTERWDALLEVYGRKRALAGDAIERKPILYAIARLQVEQLGRIDAAIETYCAALEEDPADGVALAALDDLYFRSAAWEQYADVLQRRVDLDVDEGKLVDLKFRLAAVQNEHLGDPAAALANYREILFLNQDHEGARLALEAMLEHPELGPEAASIL
ncbi:MAG TPA: hypothetical protein PLU22_19270, partial [Polyangiaceae bacterium]|nr:hypothetical protein [Polyangiaceae bacterium]